MASTGDTATAATAATTADAMQTTHHVSFGGSDAAALLAFTKAARWFAYKDASGSLDDPVAPTKKQKKADSKGHGNWLAVFNTPTAAAAAAPDPAAVAVAAVAAGSVALKLQQLSIASKQIDWSATQYDTDHMLCWLKFEGNIRVSRSTLETQLGTHVGKLLRLCPIAWQTDDFEAYNASLYERAFPGVMLPRVPRQRGAVMAIDNGPEWSRQLNDYIFQRYLDSTRRQAGYTAAVAIRHEFITVGGRRTMRKDCIDDRTYTRLFNTYQEQLAQEQSTEDTDGAGLEELFKARKLVQYAKLELNYPNGDSFQIRKNALKVLLLMQDKVRAEDAAGDERLRLSNFKRCKLEDDEAEPDQRPEAGLKKHKRNTKKRMRAAGR